MVDNTTLNSATGGDVIRDIDRSGVKTQVVQLDAGGTSGESLVSNAAGAGMPIRDTLVVLNASSWSAAGVIGAAQETTGFASFQMQITGTFTSTIIIEESDDNTNWVQAYWYTTTTAQSTSVINSATVAGNASKAFGSIRGRYIRARCSAFTSNTSGVITLILRAAPCPMEFVNVNSVQGTVSTTTVSGGPSTLALGTTAFVKASSSTNAISVKTSAGNIYGLVLTNNSAAVKYFKLYNKASTPIVGTDTPVAVFGIAANGGVLAIDHTWAIPRFSTGIAYAITGAVADTDTTATAANDVSGWIVYA